MLALGIAYLLQIALHLAYLKVWEWMMEEVVINYQAFPKIHKFWSNCWWQMAASCSSLVLTVFFWSLQNLLWCVVSPFRKIKSLSPLAMLLYIVLMAPMFDHNINKESGVTVNLVLPPMILSSGRIPISKVAKIRTLYFIYPVEFFWLFMNRTV